VSHMTKGHMIHYYMINASHDRKVKEKQKKNKRKGIMQKIAHVRKLYKEIIPRFNDFRSGTPKCTSNEMWDIRRIGKMNNGSSNK
jgi:hypothetical protein